MANPVDQLQKSLNIQPQRNMSDKIFEQISRLIQSGDIPEGYVFPNESALCEQLSVGRSTIREAYKALELSGYVTRTKRGTIVNSYSTILEATPLKSVVAGAGDKHFQEFRLMLEGRAAALAAERVTEDNLTQLEEISAAFASSCAAENFDQIVALDRDFHEAIVSFTHNALFITAMAAIGEACEEKTREELSHVDTLQDVFNHLITDHQAILRALRRHDGETATNYIVAHLTGEPIISEEMPAEETAEETEEDYRTVLASLAEDEARIAEEESAKQNENKSFTLLPKFLRKK